MYTNNVLEGLLIVDMIVHFCRAYHNSKGALVYDLKAIRTRYLSESFILDIVAALPLQTLVAFNGSVNAGYVAWLRLPKMIRIYRLIKLHMALQRQTGHVGVLKGILRLVPLLFCLTHLYACALLLDCFELRAALASCGPLRFKNRFVWHFTHEAAFWHVGPCTLIVLV